MLGGRFCFFLADKREEFIHFSGLDLPGLRRFGQATYILFDPQSYRPMMDTQMSSGSSQIHTIHVQPNRLLTNLGIVAMPFLYRRIFAPAEHAPITLAACQCSTSFVLSLGAITLRTLFHTIYSSPLLYPLRKIFWLVQAAYYCRLVIPDRNNQSLH